MNTVSKRFGRAVWLALGVIYTLCGMALFALMLSLMFVYSLSWLLWR